MEQIIASLPPSLGVISRVTVGSSTFQTTGFQTGTAALGYQGYTVASGHILTKITEGMYSGQWLAICVVMCRDMSHPVVTCMSQCGHVLSSCGHMHVTMWSCAILMWSHACHNVVMCYPHVVTCMSQCGHVLSSCGHLHLTLALCLMQTSWSLSQG